jgi:hypothetical protein
LRERGRDQSPRHPIGERGGTADRRAYRREAASAQEATAVDLCAAAEDDRIGSLLSSSIERSILPGIGVSLVVFSLGGGILRNIFCPDGNR